jgi:RNA polymerase sigma-54 factor
MKQSLQLRLSQHLALTPQLQQSIRLLQLSTLELNQEIEQALQDNTLLERQEVIEVPAYSPSSDTMVQVQPQEQAAEERPQRESDQDAELSWGSEILRHGPRDPDDDTTSAISRRRPSGCASTGPASWR